MGETNPLSESEGSSPTDMPGTEEQFLMTDISTSQCEPVLDPVDSSFLLPTDQEYDAAVSFGEKGLPIQPHLSGADAVNISKPLVPYDSRVGSKPFAGGLDNPANLYFPLGHMPTTTGFAVNTPELPNPLFRRSSRLTDHIDFIRYTIRANGLADASSVS